MSRRTRMPLYEVMRPGVRRPPGTATGGSGGDDVRFGGVVRLPVGTVLVGAAGVILALVLAYAAGYSRARDAARQDLEQALLDQRIDVGGDERFAAAGSPDAPDPGGGDRSWDRSERRGAAGDERDAGDAPEGGRGTAGSGNRDAATGGGRGAGAGAADDGGTPPPGTPPRADWQRPRFQWQDAYVLDPIATTPGPWYWTLMTTDLEGARRFIDFARARGLETYAVAVNNARSRYRVYVVPGLQTRSPDHPWHAPMAAAIEAIGREWAREPGSGGGDLGDAYLHRYD